MSDPLDEALAMLDEALAMLDESLGSTAVSGDAAASVALAERRVRLAREMLTVRRGERVAAEREAQDAAAAALEGGVDAPPAPAVMRAGDDMTPAEAGDVPAMTAEQAAAALADNRRRVERVPTSWRSLARALGVSEGMVRAWRDEGATEAPGGRPMSAERKELGRAIARAVRWPAA